ncbi:TetR/AcrR family transcriptional regulator [Mycobacterium riyadhense]|uniref:TetR/AcrR family transcriptional regulator n=1 Tax=Mycobacterium riyadhense TaxID=486698 RepID=UPI00194F107E|nr:TetR/AcrR family transcriptional regulator [Mycobacterium riyadhense]
MTNPRATNEDLTAKARIRNAALDLYAQFGEDRISLRAIAAEAGVTLGLVQHHFKTKAGLRNAVDRLVVDHFAQAIAEVPTEGPPAELAVARDNAVRRMLVDNPAVVNYIRRSVLEASDDRMHLLDVLVELTRSEVAALRQAGVASTRRRESIQVVTVLLRQMGELLLQPFVDATWERVAPAGDGPKPRLSVAIRED